MQRKYQASKNMKYCIILFVYSKGDSLVGKNREKDTRDLLLYKCDTVNALAECEAGQGSLGLNDK